MMIDCYCLTKRSSISYREVITEASKSSPLLAFEGYPDIRIGALVL